MNARDVTRKLGEHPLDWLAAVLLSWIIPLGLVGRLWTLTYRLSLLFWLVPIALLLPRFLSRTRTGRARAPGARRAFVITVAYVIIAGCVLDFVLGSWILLFDEAGDYLLRLPSLSSSTDFVPIEEVLFYVLGAIAIILTYFWADDYWLNSYSRTARSENLPAIDHLVAFSPPAMTVGVALLLLGILFASWKVGEFRIPLYFSFLVVVAFVPAIALYRSVDRLVNWRAFSLTTLYVLLTSCIWEVTLALPRKWWGYKEEAMLGQDVDVWKLGEWGYPVEALLVWLVVTFTCVLTYEAVRAYQADPRNPRKRLFG